MNDRTLAVGQVWRVRRTGTLRRITKLTNLCPQSERPYYDIAWETVIGPKRRGATNEGYWWNNCAPASWPQYIYVASSWRNDRQPEVVAALNAAGIDCYDFRNPAPGQAGFSWSEIDPDWLNWTADQYVAALEHPLAEAGFNRDFDAMQRADAFVLVLPCGRSAHLELGWAVGQGKRTAVLTQDGEEPELMAKMVDHIATSVDDLLAWLAPAQT